MIPGGAMLIPVVLGLTGAVSLGVAHWWVQRDAPELVPPAWAAWLGALWLAPWVVLGVGSSGSAVWVYGVVSAVTGAAAWPVALHVAQRRAELADDARVGRREKAAAKVLRRATPEERRRVLEPRTGSVDLNELVTLARTARRGVQDLVRRESGQPPRAA